MNGMDDNGDEHNFSDDDFDSLPINALDELEQNAIRSTQPPQPQNNSHTAAKPQSLPGNARQAVSYARPHLQHHAQPQNWQDLPRQLPQYVHYNDDSYA